jgi:hypothetical protein
MRVHYVNLETYLPEREIYTIKSCCSVDHINYCCYTFVDNKYPFIYFILFILYVCILLTAIYFAVANPYDVVNVSLQLALYHIVDMVI